MFFFFLCASFFSKKLMVVMMMMMRRRRSMIMTMTMTIIIIMLLLLLLLLFIQQKLNPNKHVSNLMLFVHPQRWNVKCMDSRPVHLTTLLLVDKHDKTRWVWHSSSQSAPQKLRASAFNEWKKMNRMKRLNMDENGWKGQVRLSSPPGLQNILPIPH